jgi:hypothetical protein
VNLCARALLHRLRFRYKIKIKFLQKNAENRILFTQNHRVSDVFHSSPSSRRRGRPMADAEALRNEVRSILGGGGFDERNDFEDERRATAASSSNGAGGFKPKSRRAQQAMAKAKATGASPVDAKPTSGSKGGLENWAWRAPRCQLPSSLLHVCCFLRLRRGGRRSSWRQRARSQQPTR